MAKDITIKNPEGTLIYYPKTVSQLVYDNANDKTVATEISEINEDINAILLHTFDDEVMKVINRSMTIDGTFGSGSTYKHSAYPVNVGEKYVVCVSKDNVLAPVTMRMAYATTDVAADNSPVPFVDGTGYINLEVGGHYLITVPEGCTHLLFNKNKDNYYTVHLKKWYVEKEVVEGSNAPVSSDAVYNEIDKQQYYYTLDKDADMSIITWHYYVTNTNVVGETVVFDKGTTNWRHSDRIEIPEGTVKLEAKVGYRNGSPYPKRVIFVDDNNGYISSIDEPSSGVTQGQLYTLKGLVPSGATGVFLCTGVYPNTDAQPSNCTCKFYIAINEGLNETNEDIAELENKMQYELYGTEGLQYTLRSTCVRIGLTKGQAAAKAAGYSATYGDGLWNSVSNYRSFIYDLTNVTYSTITIQSVARMNFHSYVFLRSLDLKTSDSSDISKWQAAYCDQPHNTVLSTNTTRSTHIVEKPDDAVYLVVLGYANTSTNTFVDPIVTVSVNDNSFDYRLDRIEETVITESEKSWVTDEKNRIKGLLNGLLPHELVIFSFNTDQHIKKSNRDGVLRGLRAIRDLTEIYNFDLIVCGGDDSYGNDATVTSVMADINDVNNTVDTTVCPVINIVGNHEGGQNLRWNRSIWNARTNFRLKTQRVINRYNTVLAVNEGGNFVIDDDVKHCRYIFLDPWSKDANTGDASGYINAQEAQWYYKTKTVIRDGVEVEVLETTRIYWYMKILRLALEDSKLFNSDWKVYIFCHNVLAPYDGETPYADNGVAPVFEDTEYVTKSYTYNKIMDEAISNGVNIICAVNGHSHTVSYRVDHGILYSSTASAGEKNGSANSFEKRIYEHIANTPTETLFDIYIHDLTAQRLYALSYGAPSDRIWDLSGNDPVLLLTNLTVNVTSDTAVDGGTVTISYHNTTFEGTIVHNEGTTTSGKCIFPYITPERIWNISVTLPNGDGIDNVELNAVAGNQVINIEI